MTWLESSPMRRCREPAQAGDLEPIPRARAIKKPKAEGCEYERLGTAQYETKSSST